MLQFWYSTSALVVSSTTPLARTLRRRHVRASTVRWHVSYALQEVCVYAYYRNCAYIILVQETVYVPIPVQKKTHYSKDSWSWRTLREGRWVERLELLSENQFRMPVPLCLIQELPVYCFRASLTLKSTWCFFMSWMYRKPKSVSLHKTDSKFSWISSSLENKARTSAATNVRVRV